MEKELRGERTTNLANNFNISVTEKEVIQSLQLFHLILLHSLIFLSTTMDDFTAQQEISTDR